MPDRVGLLVIDSRHGVHRLVTQINIGSPRRSCRECPTLGSLPTLWTDSSVVATVGGTTLEDVKRHVENEENV